MRLVMLTQPDDKMCEAHDRAEGVQTDTTPYLDKLWRLYSNETHSTDATTGNNVLRALYGDPARGGSIGVSFGPCLPPRKALAEVSGNGCYTSKTCRLTCPDLASRAVSTYGGVRFDAARGAGETAAAAYQVQREQSRGRCARCSAYFHPLFGIVGLRSSPDTCSRQFI